MALLRGERLTLRPPAEGDAESLHRIHAEPGVERWWGPHSLDDVRGTLAGEDPDGAVSFVIEVDGEVAGMIQYAEIGSPEFRHAAIDLFLACAHQGRGLGRESINVLVAHLIDDLGHHRLVIDPAVANERAVRCYEAVGFRRVGVMRRYQRMADGSYEDGLLLELVVEPSP